MIDIHGDFGDCMTNLIALNVRIEGLAPFNQDVCRQSDDHFESRIYTVSLIERLSRVRNA